MSTTCWKYPPYQEAGQRLQRWIDGHCTHHCNVSVSALDSKAIEDAGWDFLEGFTGLPEEVRSDAINQGLPYEQSQNVADTNYHSFFLTKEMPSPPMDPRTGDSWLGRTGPGVIFLEEIRRIHNSPNAAISEISIALYKVDNDIGTLKYVYVLDVINEETRPFVVEKLYTAAHGIDPTNPVAHEWNYGTLEYQGILGTRIGKTVAYLMLNAFNKGTHRISKIVTLPDFQKAALHIRFDIERIP